MKRKELKLRYSASMLPMRMFGGSPIIVAVPPRLMNIASPTSSGTGERFTNLQSLIVTWKRGTGRAEVSLRMVATC